MSVIFILATTDPQKIIDTVHSRCFQLFFRPIDIEVLHARLREVCQKEQIPYDDAGLALITKQTEGSARDALNLLEQVRFSSKSVTQEAVLQILGHVPDQELIDILETVITLSPIKLLQKIELSRWQRYSAQLIWVRMIELIRASLWLKHGVDPELFTEYHDRIKSIVKLCTAHDLMHFLQQMYDQELLFSKTTAKHEFLEMVLLQMCYYFNRARGDDNGSSSSGQATASQSFEQVVVQNDLIEDDGLEQEDPEDDQEQEDEDDDSLEVRKKHFISALSTLEDPIIQTIFSQGSFKEIHDENGAALAIEFSRQFLFFDSLLEQAKPSWFSLLQAQFGNQIAVRLLFTGEPIKRSAPVVTSVQHDKPSAVVHKKTEPTLPRSAQAQQPAAQPQKPAFNNFNKAFAGRGNSRQLLNPFPDQVAIDISDKNLWQKTHMIMRHIPGVVTELREGAYEK